MTKNEEDQSLRDEAPSRSQQRREALAVLEIAKRLAEAQQSQLDRIALPEDLREEIRKTRQVKQQIARKRQIQYLAKRLRADEDSLATIEAALDEAGETRRKATATLHRAEHWRDNLLAGDEEILARFLADHPSADRQALKQLLRQAKKESKEGKPPRASRKIFQFIATLTGDE